MADDNRKLGVTALAALVVSAMIGGGIFSLPQNMAQSAALMAVGRRHISLQLPSGGAPCAPLPCETACLALPDSPFCIPERPVLQRKTAYIARPWHTAGCAVGSVLRNIFTHNRFHSTQTGR